MSFHFFLEEEMWFHFSLTFYHNHVLSSFMTYHRLNNKRTTTGATCGTGTAYSSEAPEFNPRL